jgi:hypothetical protein
MGIISANYEIVSLSGTMDLVSLGYGGTSGSSIHQIYCISSGSILINAVGGGNATFALTTGQFVDVVASKVTVSSGTFIGFRSKTYNTGNQF